MKRFLKHLLSYFDIGKVYKVNNSRIKIPYDTLVFSLPSGRDLETNFVMRCLQKLKINSEDTMIIDVGANVGQTMLSVKAAYPHIEYIGFEPNPVCVNYLNKLIRVNRLLNARIFPFALSDKNDMVEFFKTHAHDPRATIHKEFFEEAATSEIIPVLRFDDLSGVNIRKKLVVKIDVEGAELNVIKGMNKLLQEHNPVIICEVLHSHLVPMQQRAEELSVYLKSIGYKIYTIEHSSITFRPVEKFVMQTWGENSIRECDYILSKAAID